MAGRLRAYPELRDISALTPEKQALEVLVAVYELHTHGDGHPIDNTAPWGTIKRGTLGLEALHNLTTHEPLCNFHKTDALTVHGYHLDANKGGKDRKKFVRWAMDRILPPRLMSQISGLDWAHHVLNEMRDVAAELQRATKEVDDEILRNGQKEAEGTRFNELLHLLEKCLDYTQQHLKTHANVESRLGVEELALITNDTDIVYCMRSDRHLRAEYRNGREWKIPRHICFKNMAGPTLKRLKKRGHSLPLENALRIMLGVIPTLAHMPSASVAGSTYLLPTRDYTPRRHPAADNMTEDNDEVESSAGGSTVRNSIKGAPVPSMEPAPRKSTFPPKMPPKDSAPWKGSFGSLGPKTNEQRTPTKAANAEIQVLTSPLNSSTPQHRDIKGVQKAITEQNSVQSQGCEDPANDNEGTTTSTHVNQNLNPDYPLFDYNWRQHHKEYHAWPRTLIIDHKIKLTLANDQRWDFLDELSKAEHEGRLPFGDQLTDDEREAVYDNMLYNLKIIKQAVQTAKVKSFKPSNSAKPAVERTLWQVVDLMEGEEGFGDAVDDDGDSVMSDERSKTV